MNSSLYDQNSSSLNDIIKISEMLSTENSNQPLTTTTTSTDGIDIINDDKHQSNDFIHKKILNKKQKSLISVYDNNPQHQQYYHHPLVGIIGRNKRSQAFLKRLLLSNFPKPILCDINSTETDLNQQSDYLSYETFYEYSPTIILITDDLTTNFEDLFHQNNQQLIIDTREILPNKILASIPGSYRAFGNLSNWEIENGTQRISVTVEQYAPKNLIKFIYDLNCFSRGILFLDEVSYNNQQSQSLKKNCFVPLISSLIVFILCCIISIIEHSHENHNSGLIYRQASSITAATSITLLALVFLIRPLLELIEFISSAILKKPNINENFLLKQPFIQYWLESRPYLSWYSLSFTFLHILFLLFSKLDLNSPLFISTIFVGIFTLLLLLLISYVYFPWISERLQWSEYHLLISYIGPLSLFLAFIHNYLAWKLETHIYTLKFFSMLLPFIVLLIRLIIYGIIHSIKRIRNRL